MQANNLSQFLTATSGIRDIATVNSTLSGFNMKQGTDYSMLQNARKLEANEYTIKFTIRFYFFE